MRIKKKSIVTKVRQGDQILENDEFILKALCYYKFVYLNQNTSIPKIVKPTQEEEDMKFDIEYALSKI